MPTLHVIEGPDQGRTYQVPAESAVIGRSSEEIQLSDAGSSRRHAEIRRANGGWLVADLGSSNGTLLNGEPVVSVAPLGDGDHVRIGNTVLVFAAQEHIDGFTGAQRIRDLVDLDLDDRVEESAIIEAVDTSEDSVILKAPETADAVAAWNVVHRIAETMSTPRSTEAFLENTADIIFEHLVADRLVLLTCAGRGKELVPQVVRYRTTDRSQRPRIVTSRSVVQHVVETRDGVLCANTMTEDRFHRHGNEDSIQQMGMRSVICVPIVAGDEIHGVCHLDCATAHHTYTPEQLRIAVAIGRLTGMVIQNARLVEERMRTERLAAVGEAAAYLSHHIRNILQGLQGGADVVELGFRKENLGITKSGWRLVSRNLDRICQLTMNMLTFSKKRQPRIDVTQLNTIVEEVVGLVRGRADERSISLAMKLGDIPEIPLDVDGVHQAVHNILINAIDVVPADSGRVDITTALDSVGGCVVLSIRDNGPGIPPEAIETMFQAFQSSKGHGGTGLGLAAAKKIVDELNGRLEADGAIDAGTTFHIRLPLVQPNSGENGGSDPDE